MSQSETANGQSMSTRQRNPKSTKPPATYQEALNGGPGALDAFFQAKGRKGGKKGGANSRKNMTPEEAREVALKATLSKDGSKPPVITADDVPTIRKRLAMMAAAKEQLKELKAKGDGLYPANRSRKVAHLQAIVSNNAPLALSREYGCPVQSIKNIQFGLSFAWVQ